MNTLLRRSFCTVKKQSLVVIGTGWANYKLLSAIDHKQYDVTIVSPRNHFVFTPLLAGTSVGTLEFRCVAEPIKSLGPQNKYYDAFAVAIDTENQTVECRDAVKHEEKKSFNISYDKLIIGVGAVSNTFNTPGVKENAFFLKEIADARHIRKRIIDCFDLASEPNVSEEKRRALLHFAVIGGGPTGIELSAEIHDFIRDDLLRLYPHLKGLEKLTVYDVADKILGAFDQKLGDYALKQFKREKIEVKTGTKIKEVKPDSIIINDGEEVGVGLVVWATGNGPCELIKSLKLPKDKAHRLLTDGFLNVLSESKEPMKNVFAMGDCSNIEDYSLPQTAQVAEQKGKYLAHRLNGKRQGTVPFQYKHKGAMAYIGDWKALVEAPHSYKGGGRLSWLIWRSAYFTMTVSWRNKILIPSYWFITWLFGRDITNF